MMEFYLPIKWVHICAVLLSGCLFALRGGAALCGAVWPYAAAARYTSYAIDTMLLSAALMLATILPAGYFSNHWLTTKLALIAVYIVLGAFALRRTRSRGARVLCLAAALATFVSVIGIAIAHHPLGWVLLLHN